MCRAHESRVLMDSEPAAASRFGFPWHRPAVAFGACRASAPPRRPAVAWGVCQGGVSSGFSVPRVREPGTAEREPAGLRPEGGRRCPGTRPSCPWLQTSPLRPPVGEVLSGALPSSNPLPLPLPMCWVVGGAAPHHERDTGDTAAAAAAAADPDPGSWRLGLGSPMLARA
jgi:hypothetical protein